MSTVTEEAQVLRMDFGRREVVDTGGLPWVPSPLPGVHRRQLERSGGERGRATSIVRYAPEARFAAHAHPAGEEILVLDGVFEDEHGSYPAGSYLKNPPGSRHAPGSTAGCLLFVKLRHLQADDAERVVVRPGDIAWQPGFVEGLTVQPLSDFAGEHAALVRWAPGTVFNLHRHWGGEEILVLDGVFEDEHGRYPAGTWLRNPHLSAHAPFSTEGCTIFVKMGHLPEAEDA